MASRSFSSVRIGPAQIRRPMHDIEHAGQGIERGFQGRLVIDIVGQNPQRGADQEIGLPQCPRDLVEAARQGDAPWARAISRPKVTACA